MWFRALVAGIIVFASTSPALTQSGRRAAPSGAARTVPVIAASASAAARRSSTSARLTPVAMQAHRDSILEIIGFIQAQLDAPIRLSPGTPGISQRGWLLIPGVIHGVGASYGEPAYAEIEWTRPENPWYGPHFIELHLETQANARYLVDCEFGLSDFIYVQQGANRTTFADTPLASFVLQATPAGGPVMIKMRVGDSIPRFYGCDVTKLPQA
jgi:hypothetical protein